MRARVLLAAAVSLMGLFAAACSGDGDARPTPTPAATKSSPTADPTRSPETPTAAPTPVIRTLETRPAIAPPANSQLFIVTGCTQCDGPDETLQLHQTSGAGVTAVTTIMGPGHEALEGMTIGQIDAAVDGTVLAVTACRDEYCGGVGNREQPIDWRVLVSVNDGADWTVAFESNVQYAFLEDVSVEGLIVGEIRPDGSAPSPRKLTFINLAGQERELRQPDGAGQAIILRGGLVAWIEYPGPRGGPRTKILQEDGTEIPLDLPANTDIGNVDSLQDGTLAVSMFGAFGAERALLFYPGTGGPPTSVIDLGGLALPRVHYEGQFALANDYVPAPTVTPPGPAVLDLRTLTATPLTTEFLANQQGRNRFVAYDIE